jgi:hypothetical protein
MYPWRELFSRSKITFEGRRVPLHRLPVARTLWSDMWLHALWSRPLSAFHQVLIPNPHDKLLGFSHGVALRFRCVFSLSGRVPGAVRAQGGAGGLLRRTRFPLVCLPFDGLVAATLWDAHHTDAALPVHGDVPVAVEPSVRAVECLIRFVLSAPGTPSTPTDLEAMGSALRNYLTCSAWPLRRPTRRFFCVQLQEIKVLQALASRRFRELPGDGI